MWKSTSASGAPENSSLSHFSAMTRPPWLGRAVRNRHHHAIEQVSRRWRRGRRGDSGRTRRKILISAQVGPTILLQGLAINNLVLGGKVMAGSESDARNNGLLFFGGWAAISVVARNAGLMSGQYAVPCLAWNAACAAYSVLA